ncbi:MAG: sugar phosphate isomerase/epimerase [Victivallales bacterium]|nr:sugar phosphate isomerase/epimerase [Victivallales bacterium]
MNKAQESIGDYVGVSTNVMTGIDIWEAVALTKKYELTCMEIHFGDFEAAVGNPWMIPYAGIWPRTFSKADRKRLKNELSHIKNLVIHGTPVDVNICALNPGIREESRRQYREMLELGIDLGAKWVTYHHGEASLSVVSPAYVRAGNVEFINSILAEAKAADIKLAYESCDDKMPGMIADDAFGLLLDIGHTVMGANRFSDRRGDTRTILDWIDFLGHKLIEMHIHNVINWAEMPSKGMAHRSFEYGLCLDLEQIIRKLKEKQLMIPLISEIYEPTAEQAVQTLARTKEKIIAYWNK